MRYAFSLGHIRRGGLWKWAFESECLEKLMCCDKYPLVTFAEARGRRDESRKMLANGIDPIRANTQMAIQLGRCS
jgi:hypothetical protein